MNAAIRPLVADAAPSATPRSWLRFVLGCWRRITLKQVLVINLIALLIDVWFVLTWLREYLQAYSWEPLVWAVGESAMVATGMLLVIAVADRVAPTRWPWWTPYAIGALLGGLVVNLLTIWCFEYLIPVRTLMDYFFSAADVARKRTVIEVTDGVVTCGVAIFAYAWLRRLHLQRSRLHALQQDKVTASRRLAEARLRAMQAQIEPEFLLDTLARIEYLQGIDAERALCALDALIVYLRVTTPRDGNTMSTLGGELALMRAWLEVVRTARDETIVLETALPDGAESEPFPAMLLPCVIKHEASLAAHPASGVAVLHLEAEFAEACLRIRVCGIATDYAWQGDDRIESLRAGFASLYGNRARFTRQIRAHGDGYRAETVIEIPR